MSELKNLIVVDITDKENIVLAPTGIGATGVHDIKEIKGSGTILIKNPSQQSRLWNLTCDLKEVMDTTLDKMLNVGTINPAQEFKKDYELQNLKEPCLKVSEIFDTEKGISNTVNNVFLYEKVNDCSLKINLVNSVDLPVTEIKVVKEIPEIFKEIQIQTPSSGTAEVTDEGGKKVVIWNIPSLDGKQSASIDIFLTVNAKERENYSLGSLKVNYLINNLKLNNVDPEVRALTDSMSGASRDESDTPQTWDCNVEFNNDSEFKVRLEDVKVTHKIPTGSENVLSETPNLELDPEAAWDKDFKIEASADVPELEPEIKFTALFGVVTRIIGEIVKEPTIYNVISTEVQKAINPPEVAAYANTEMTIENTISNKGTSPIVTLEITDEIPVDFIPPLTKDIKLKVKNPEETVEIQERFEYIDKLEISPADQSPDSKHLILVKLKDMEKLLPPNSDVILSYPISAKNPKPEVKYNTPIETKANVTVKGNDFIISPPEEPEIKIKYVARKLKTLKSIKPGVEAGEFNISVRIQNKGEVELENLVVKDKIPAGFSVTDAKFDHPYEIIPKGNSSEIEAKIAYLKGQESVSLNYTCSGSGDYPRSEPVVNVLGRGSGTKAPVPPKPSEEPEESEESNEPENP